MNSIPSEGGLRFLFRPGPATAVSKSSLFVSRQRFIGGVLSSLDLGISPELVLLSSATSGSSG